MLILLEDDKEDLKSLIKALTAEGIKREHIRQFSTLKKAIKDLGELDKKKMNAIAIISDVGLGNTRHTGIEFIAEQFHRFKKETGGGVWTVLISIEDLTQRDFTHIHPLPHWTYNKDKPDWAEACARDIKRLFFSQFHFDEDNDFAPPKELDIPPTDRIYLYSSGDAEYLSPSDDVDANDYFAFNQVSEVDQQETHPIFMYRGRYIYTSQFTEKVSPKVIRVLLRWRIAALECAKPENRSVVKEVYRDSNISIGHICSYVPDSPDSNNPELDEEHGFRLRSVNNDFVALRNQPDIIKLEDFLLPEPNRHVLDKFPNTRTGTLPGKKKKLTKQDIRGLQLPFLEVAASRKVQDNFLTRLHFVLSARELINYKEWKQEWRKRFFE